MRNNLLPQPSKKTKVAILGYSDSRQRAPFDESDWEIWGLNALYELFPDYAGWDRWFELHKRKVNLDDEGPGHIWRLAGMKCPIYMQRHYEDIPTSIEYPIKEVIQEFGAYLTSSFSFMAALAIREGFKEIGVYGVDTADEEWGSQRPSLEYLLGIARGRGIRVTIPAESSLCRAPFLYAYQEREDHEFFATLLNKERICQDGLDQARAKRKRYELQEATYAGGLAAIRDLRQEWRLPFNFGGWDEREVPIDGEAEQCE